MIPPMLIENQRPKEFFTKTQLAEYFSVSTKTIQREVAKGMPSIIVGGHRRFELSEVTRWFKQKRNKSWPKSKS